MFQEIDWLMNEEGDINRIDSIRNMVGENTRLITCLANWNKKDAKKVVVDAQESRSWIIWFCKARQHFAAPANFVLPFATHRQF